MSFPWVFSSEFESTITTPFGWDSEADTGSQLDVPHYSELARFPWSTCAPYTGAYCMRLQLTGGTADAYLQEGDIDIADTVNGFFKFNIWFSPDFTGTADDTFNIFEARSASAEEVTFGARIVTATDVINFGIGKVAPTTFGSSDIERNKWYTVEIDATIQTGGTGTIDIYATKEGETPATSVFAAQVGTLTQIAVTHGRLGVQDHLATTTGTILIDNFVMDDTRVYPTTDRFSQSMVLTESGHAFVGSGVVDNVSLLSGAGTDCVLSVYDTDESNTDDASNIKLELKNTANNELVDPAGAPFDVTRGAYVDLSGTNPRALLKICKAGAYGSSASIRNYGLRR
jgi:hypothetical protein